MVNMQTLPPSLSLLVCSLLATTSSALHVRPRLDVYPTPVANLPNAAAPATITAAPPLDILGDLKFARALPTIPSCATSCVASAVTKSTDCKLGDYQCECNFATVINQGAASCVQTACGFEGALQAQVAGEQLCLSVLGGLVPSSTPTNNNNNNPSPSPGSGSSSSNGSSPKPSSSSGGSSGSGSGSNSGSGSGSNSGSGSSSGSHKPSKKTKLSGGAIAGIVVGVVAGISAAAGAIWKFCLTKMKGGSTAEGTAAAGVNGTNGAPPSGTALETAQVHPDPAKPTGLTSTTPLSTTPSELSNNHPHTVSSVSPPYQSPVTPTPPVYPNAAELPNGSWPQQQQPPAGYVYPPPQPTGQPMHGYQVPGQQQQYAPVQSYPQMHQDYHEAPGAPPPEMAGDTHIVQELHGQTTSGGVYEMGH
ncbi:uncharacterized protein TrAtP1_012974 [Trichoderma atroviride]|uniref:uncharacterized protein n=1 Tax=Hypocrea atroviridis TaxID=63577 RepID=UPI003326A02B|nr:hypothetical protein TrAtP1_012974 [Trichoderma atroviride]